MRETAPNTGSRLQGRRKWLRAAAAAMSLPLLGRSDLAAAGEPSRLPARGHFKHSVCYWCFEKLGLIDYISEHADDRQLSMRLLGSSLRKYQYARDEGLDWRPLVKSQVQNLGMKQATAKRLDSKARDLRVLRDALAKFPESVKDQITFWSDKTQKSKASFYRIVARYREEDTR